MTPPAIYSYGASAWRLASRHNQLFHSADDRYLLCYASAWQFVELIDLSTGQPAAQQYPYDERCKHRQAFDPQTGEFHPHRFMAFAEGNNQLAVVLGSRLTRAPVDQLAQPVERRLEADACALAISACGSRIAVALENGLLLLFDQALNEIQRHQLELPALQLSFNPHAGQLAIYAAAGRSQRIWLLEEPSQLTRLSGARGSWGGWCWYQHELLLACGKQLYRWQSGSSRLQPWYQADSAVGLIGADQQRLIFTQQQQLVALDWHTAEPLWQRDYDPAAGVALQSGRLAYVENGLLQVLDIVSQQQLACFRSPARAFDELSLSHDGRFLCASSWDRALYRWSLQQGDASHPLAAADSLQQWYPLADSQQWLTQHPQQLLLWQAGQRYPLRQLPLADCRLLVVDDTQQQFWAVEGEQLGCYSLTDGTLLHRLAVTLPPGDPACLLLADEQRLLYISASDFLKHGQLLLIQGDSGELLNQLALPPDIVAARVAQQQLWLQSANGERYRVCLQSLQLSQTSHYQRHYDATMQPGVATVNSLSPCHRLLLEYGELQPAAEQSCGLCWLRVVDLHNNQQLVLEKQYPSEILLACFSADESRVLTVHKDAAGGYQLCITGLNDVCAVALADLPLAQGPQPLGYLAPRPDFIRPLAHNQAVIVGFDDGRFVQLDLNL